MATKITFKASELRRLLSNAILFAAPAKDCLPALEVVRFDWDGDHLLAVATNRYVLSYEEAFPVESAGRDPFSVNTADAKRIVAMIPKTADTWAQVTVEYDDETRWAQFAYMTDTIRVNTEHGQFAQWRKLIDGKTAERETVVFNPKYLALFAKVDCDQRETMVHFRFADTPNGGPVQVTMGEHFKGLIMAVSHAG